MPGADVVHHHQEAALPQRRSERAEASDALEPRLEELDCDVARLETDTRARACSSSRGRFSWAGDDVRSRFKNSNMSSGRLGSAANRCTALQRHKSSTSRPSLSASAILNNAAGGSSVPPPATPRASASIPTTPGWRTDRIGWKWLVIPLASTSQRIVPTIPRFVRRRAEASMAEMSLRHRLIGVGDHLLSDQTAELTESKQTVPGQLLRIVHTSACGSTILGPP